MGCWTGVVTGHVTGHAGRCLTGKGFPRGRVRALVAGTSAVAVSRQDGIGHANGSGWRRGKVRADLLADVQHESRPEAHEHAGAPGESSNA